MGKEYRTIATGNYWGPKPQMQISTPTNLLAGGTLNASLDSFRHIKSFVLIPKINNNR